MYKKYQKPVEPLPLPQTLRLATFAIDFVLTELQPTDDPAWRYELQQARARVRLELDRVKAGAAGDAA